MEGLHTSQCPAFKKREQTPNESYLSHPLFLPVSLRVSDFHIFSEAPREQQCLMNAFGRESRKCFKFCLMIQIWKWWQEGIQPLENNIFHYSLHSRGQIGCCYSSWPLINSCLFMNTLTTINIYFKIQNLAMKELGKWYYFLSNRSFTHRFLSSYWEREGTHQSCNNK